MSPVLLHCGLRRGSLSLLTEGSLLFCPCLNPLCLLGELQVWERKLLFTLMDIINLISTWLWTLIETAHFQLHWLWIKSMTAQEIKGRYLNVSIIYKSIHPGKKNHTLPLPNVSLTSESTAQMGVLWRKPEHQEKSSLWLLPEWHHPYLWASFKSTRSWTVDEQIRLVPPSVCHQFRHFLFCITPRADLLAIVKSW